MTRTVSHVVIATFASVCAGAGLAAGTATAEPAMYALPACYGAGAPPVERPDQVIIQTCADGSKELTHLAWTSWGPAGAEGTGTYSYRVCEPNCAAGYQVSFQAVIHADEPQPATVDSKCPANTSFYDNLVIAFPDRVPDDTVNMRYRGLPAVLYSTVGDPAGPTSLGKVTC
ncbi:MAG: hypothetical protein ABW137_26660 [Mycobacterium sp.]